MIVPSKVLLPRRPKVPEDFVHQMVHSENALDFVVGEEKLRSVWLGHACFFVQLENGICFVTDPVLTDRCGPLGLLGPKRVTPAGATAQQLKERADFVLISHVSR